MIAEVLVEISNSNVDKTFDYNGILYDKEKTNHIKKNRKFV